MVSAVGADELGDRALDFLGQREVQCASVTRDPKHATGRVLVTLDATGQASYEFAVNTAWDHLSWSDQRASLARRCDAVCFGTLGQRSSISRDTIRRFVEATPPTALKVFDVNLVRELAHQIHAESFAPAGANSGVIVYQTLIIDLLLLTSPRRVRGLFYLRSKWGSTCTQYPGGAISKANNFRKKDSASGCLTRHWHFYFLVVCELSALGDFLLPNNRK